MNVTFTSEDDGARLDRALAARLPQHSRSFIARLIDEGRVTLQGKPVVRPSLRVADGQHADID
ncbi:MAG: RNA-binding S4 domain-containing protein, partial [bacterium]